LQQNKTLLLSVLWHVFTSHLTGPDPAGEHSQLQALHAGLVSSQADISCLPATLMLPFAL
jgi:hypothetical protein